MYEISVFGVHHSSFCSNSAAAHIFHFKSMAIDNAVYLHGAVKFSDCWHNCELSYHVHFHQDLFQLANFYSMFSILHEMNAVLNTLFPKSMLICVISNSNDIVLLECCTSNMNGIVFFVNLDAEIRKGDRFQKTLTSTQMALICNIF